MTINISVSNTTQNNCDHIIQKLNQSGIEARIIETTSIFNSQIEKGCLVTLGKQYNSSKQIANIWNTIRPGYNCAYIDIDNGFKGCIFDYLDPKLAKIKPNKTLCPHDESLL